MKTNYYQMDLMVQNQSNKDIVFNESIFKIDSFLNSSIVSFIQNKPKTLGLFEKYVILEGEDSNKICYSRGQPNIIELLRPYEGMILYFIKESSFFIFQVNKWEPVVSNVNSSENSSQQEVIEPQINLNFTAIEGKFTPVFGKDLYHIYLNDDAEIDVSTMKNLEITIIIKQHYQLSKKLEWSNNILWSEKITHTIITPNSIDIIKLYRLPETNHFLGEIVGKNYQL
jgi:hypothetical protein